MNTANAYSPELPSLLQAVVQEMLTERQREHLASICIELAAAYLTLLRHKGYRLFYRLPDFSEKGVAADAIAELFADPVSGISPHFKKYLSRNAQDLQTPSSCLLVLRRLCGQRMQQHLRICFYENDPDSAKLYRNLRLAVKRIKGISLQKNLLTTWVLIPSARECASRRRLTWIELQRIAQQACYPNMMLDELARTILQQTMKLGNLPLAIDFADLYHLIRLYHIKEPPMGVAPPQATFDLQWQELYRSMQARLQSIRQTTLDRYIREGKLSKKEGLALYAALCDLAHDLLFGDSPALYFEYIKRHLPLLSQEAYDTAYRQIVDYMVRILRLHAIETVGKYF